MKRDFKTGPLTEEELAFWERETTLEGGGASPALLRVIGRLIRQVRGMSGGLNAEQVRWLRDELSRVHNRSADDCRQDKIDGSVHFERYNAGMAAGTHIALERLRKAAEHRSDDVKES